MQKCACVVLVHGHANVLVSVHDGVCVRVVGAGSCGHVAHGLSDAPAPAGRGSPCGESQGTSGAALGTYRLTIFFLFTEVLRPM